MSWSFVEEEKETETVQLNKSVGRKAGSGPGIIKVEMDRKKVVGLPKTINGLCGDSIKTAAFCH